MQCVICSSKWVVNKKFCLCDNCNFKRLHEGKTKWEVSSRKPVKRASNKRKSVLEADREVYLRLFLDRGQVCEECDTPLPDEFEIDGNLVAIWRYSHIKPKSTYPELRHDPNNFNILCLECHSKWEFGDKKEMKIYNKNKENGYCF